MRMHRIRILPGDKVQVEITPYDMTRGRITTATNSSSSRRSRKRIMKVRASVKPMCEKCKVIRRAGVVRVICEQPRHKQRQG